MANLIIPLLAGDPAVNLKPVKQILNIYDKDEDDWLPDSWIQQEQQGEEGGQEGLGLDQGQVPGRSLLLLQFPGRCVRALWRTSAA